MNIINKPIYPVLLIIILSLIGQNLLSQNQTKMVVKEVKTIRQTQVVVKDGQVFQVGSPTAPESRSKFLSLAELETIKQEISTYLTKNHFDPTGIPPIIEEFKEWIDSYSQKKSILVEDFTKELTAWLRTTTGDKHYIFQEVGRKSAGAVKLQGWYGEAYNFGLSELKWFPERIGYMNLRGFNPVQIPDARQAVDQSITFLRSTHSVIIDLRENRGGDGAMAAYLMSYFLPADSVPLWQWDSRFNEEVMSSIEHSYISLPVPRLENKKVYILTGRRTGSAAELFAIFFKSQGLATLVGENTAGGTHTMATFPVANRFTFGLPNGRMLDLKTKDDLQVSGGIAPDVLCNSNEALDKALELIQNENNSNKKKKTNGLITYYSNKNGNYNIFIMNPDGTNQRQLTNDTTENVCGIWSPDGTKMLFESGRDSLDELYIMNADGTNQKRLTFNKTPEYHHRWAPDSKRIVYVSNEDGNQEICIMDVDGKNRKNITNSEENEMFPCWSPDGESILYCYKTDNDWKIFRMNADGTNKHKFTELELSERYPQYSPDGKQVAFFTHDNGTNIRNIHVVDSNGKNHKQLTFNNWVDEDPSWSPDGQFIVFQSNRNGNYQIFKMKNDGSDQECLSNNKNSEYWPSWSWIKEL